MNSIEPVLKNFKNYVNKNFKMIGYSVTNNKIVFNECKDDVVTFKFLCDDVCKCEDLLEIFRAFTAKYDIFYEHSKYSLNGHILLHVFKLFVSC